MNVTPNPSPTAVVDSPKRVTRRASSSRTRKDNRPFSWVSLILAFLILFSGIVIGAFIMRQRYKAQQVVFAVNGTAISKDTLYRRLEAEAGIRMVRQLAEEELRLQFAKKIGVLPSQAQVDAAYAEVKKQPEFDKTLAASGMTVEELKHRILVGLTNKAILARNMKASDAEIRKFYQDNIAKNNPRALFYKPETVQLAVIVTRTEAQAREAYKQLRDQPFEAVAQKFSIDRVSRVNGGQLAPVRRGRTMASNVPGLEQAAFAMKIGQLSAPRRFGGVWWIMQCLDKTSEKTQSFAEAKKACEAELLARKGVAANARNIEEDLAAFRKSAKIQAFWLNYQPILSDL